MSSAQFESVLKGVLSFAELRIMPVHSKKQIEERRTQNLRQIAAPTAASFRRRCISPRNLSSIDSPCEMRSKSCGGLSFRE